jgi:hypothetical protein
MQCDSKHLVHHCNYEARRAQWGHFAWFIVELGNSRGGGWGDGNGNMLKSIWGRHSVAMKLNYSISVACPYYMTNELGPDPQKSEIQPGIIGSTFATWSFPPKHPLC